MPNWCENNLRVGGERKDLDAFLAECFSKNEYGRVFLDFEKIVPPPENYFRKNIGVQEIKYCKENGLIDWFTWNIGNWGTKWNVTECDIEDNDSSITVWFETAWSPPTPIMEALTKKYTSLSFTLEYSEGGVGYRGIYESQNGETLQNDSWDMTREDMIELGYLDEDEEEETA
ncbi:hypothetical protein FACS1894147_03330 [Spirochaetia bacterium]|nr:hypothetical protein FACS1894147_03330 [Spirochaetia bacterium]